ncbi:aspartate aminotransferase family protein [bacterium]|nr:aspartate aminotransferase family protein [bacterium]
MRYQYPDSFVFYRKLNKPFVRAVSASGSTIIDEAGKKYLDASGGAVVVNVGHGVPEIANSVAEQIRELAYVNGTQFTNQPVETLAAELAEILPGTLKYSYFLGSGSEANEAAVKLARNYWYEKGVKSKWKIISRTPSYHGNTLATLSLSGREHYRAVYGPLLTNFPRIPAPDPYRNPNSKGSTGEILEEEILKEGADSVAAFILEPIIGSSAGAVVPTREYYKNVARICQKHNVLIIADEVMSGMGRTGKWFSFQHYDFIPDIMTLGKGINGGIVPLSAVVAKKEIVDLLASTSGYFNHAQTYSHTPVICAVGVATVRHLKKNHLVERVAEMEGAFFEKLNELRSFPVVGDIRGKGFMAAVEFVKNKDTKEPFARSEKFAEKFTELAFKNGLILWSNVGHVDGTNGDLVMVSPPFTISLEEISEIVAKFKQTLEQML